MSQRALWPVGTDPAAANGTDQSPAAAPTAQPGAPGEPLPVRSGAALPPGSALAAQVKLARLADLLVELAETVRSITQESLAVRAQQALMCDVEKPSTPARLLSVRDVAQRLGLSERTVRRLRRKGELPAGLEIAGVIRWTPESIDAWIGGQR